MRRNSHHKVRSSDAVAPTLEGVWAYSPARHEWEFILWVEHDRFHMMNVFGQEFTSREPLEIEALSPVKVDGTNPDNYVERLAYQRAVAGWNY